MSSFDKTVKLACKPKAAVPKAKYLDPIIAATWSDDGAVHDVCKALVPRFREPNAVVVFKALIVLHTMIRTGSTDNVLSYLSSSNILRLRNISSANWEGYAAPQNLQNYALYLESRIVAYKELKHDAIKVQSESNRDMRNSQSVEDSGTITHRGRKDWRPAETSAPTRSKTIMGRKLRSMTVEKGLLRETKVVHRMIDALVECRFYLDDLEDELTITALRMLVKDLLILFQAGNEGVINVLENYFEMSHVDAKEALRLYRRFCTQTENVVEFLGVARKLQNLLNVPIPNLKHAPVSLAGALQEYLDDPNFEQNRKDYRISRGAVAPSARAKGAKASSSKSNTDGKSSPTPPKQAASNGGESSTAAASTALDGNKRETLDFFAAIEEEQPTMFNPQTDSPNTTYFQQQASINPFSQMLSAQASAQPQQFVVAAQPTGFLVPQATAQPNPFGNFFTPQLAQPGPFPTSVPQQPTGLPQPMSVLQVPQPFLQPQMTGANPFRQSMLIPQTTGMQLFGVANQTPVPVPSLPQSQTMMNLWQTSNGLPFAPVSAAPRPSFGSSSPPGTHVPARPSSTPLTSSATTSTLPPVKTHQTGTKNPFGPVSVPPPVPKSPTLFELSVAMNQPQTSSQNLELQQTQPEPPTWKNFDFGNSSLNPGAADISSVASSFAFVNSQPKTTVTPPTVQNNDGTKSATSSATGSDSLFSSSLSTQPTGLTSTSFLSSAQSVPSTPLLSSTSPGQSRLQGLKPFKPTSSFGASLFESLPPIAGSGPVTPAVTGLPFTTNAPSDHTSSSTANALSPSFGHPGSGSGSLPQSSVPSSNMSFLGSQPTGATGGFGTSSFGSTLGVGLRPHLTGGGVANPFRASIAGMPNFGASAAQPVPPLPVGLAGFQAFGSVGGMPMGLGTSQQTQQQANGSLI